MGAVVPGTGRGAPGMHSTTIAADAGRAGPCTHVCACRSRHGRREAATSMAVLAGVALRIDPRASPAHPAPECPPLKPDPSSVPGRGGCRGLRSPGRGSGRPSVINACGTVTGAVQWSPGAVSRDPDMHDAPIGARRPKPWRLAHAPRCLTRHGRPGSRQMLRVTHDPRAAARRRPARHPALQDAGRRHPSPPGSTRTQRWKRPATAARAWTPWRNRPHGRRAQRDP